MNEVLEQDIKNIADNISNISHKLSGKTLLITGGAGFLGNFILLTVDFLNKGVLEKPCKIISVDNFITGISYKITENDNFRSIKHDVKEPFAIDEKIDYVIHMAGIASPKFYRKFKIETIDVGTMGTKNMLELSRGKNVKGMLFFSSSEVYGDPDPKFVPTPETYNGNVSCIGPRSNYDESKRLGETLCKSYYETYGVPVKMVRPFNVFGPGMRMDDYRVIPNFVSKIFNGGKLDVYGDGSNTRTFCYVSDAICGFFMVLLDEEHKGEPFNVGNENDEISVENLAKLMADIFDNKVEIRKTIDVDEAYASADPKRRCPDLTKIKKLGYRTNVELRTGIQRFIKWVVIEYKIDSPLISVLAEKKII